ncbi:MAG: hypothetical protein ABI954_06200 [Pyrinomonadaceae bacterium]
MKNEMSKWMRVALLSTAAMNMFGALLFVPSFSGLREFLGLPNPSHGLYLWIISSWIFLFGVCYLWLGITGRRERLFLVVGAAGKLSFVVLMFTYYLAGEIPLTAALASLSDLFFAAIFAFYLWKTRTE